MNDVERLHPVLLAGLGQYRHAVSDTEDLVGSVNHATTTADSLLKTLQDTSVTLNATMESVDKIFLAPGRIEPKPRNDKPFDIDSYTALALAGALKEANQLLNGTSEMLGSPRLEQPIKQVNAIAAERVEHARVSGARIIDVAFWRGADRSILRDADTIIRCS